MDDPAPCEPARLDELAAVTKEYAECARAAYGIASIAGGALAFGAIAIDWLTDWSVSVVGYFLLPAIWLLVVHASRARYQRHGEVVEREGALSPRTFRRLLLAVYAFASLELTTFTLRSIAVARLDPNHVTACVVATIVATFAIIAVPVLFSLVVRRRPDATRTLWFVVFGFGATSSTSPQLPLPGADRASIPSVLVLWHGLLCVIFGLLAAAMIAEGIREHSRYRALERRLAALRGSA